MHEKSWQVTATIGQAVSGHHRVVVEESKAVRKESLPTAREWDWVVVKSQDSGRWAPGVLRFGAVGEGVALAMPIRAGICTEKQYRVPGFPVTQVSLFQPVDYRELGWSSKGNHQPEGRSPRWAVNTERLLRPWRRFMPTVHVMAEVVAGELTLAESNAVIVDELTLDAMGIQSGDEVHLTAARRLTDATSVDGETYEIVRKSVKAYKETENILRRRPEIVKRDKDGMKLPNIWMGAALREQLGLSTQDVVKNESLLVRNSASSVVVVSPSRRFAVEKNFREAAIVISLAALGFNDQIHNVWPDYELWILLTLGVVLPLSMIWWRVRTMLR